MTKLIYLLVLAPFLPFACTLNGQTWEISPVVSFLRMKNTELGSINLDNPVDNDTRVAQDTSKTMDINYGVRVTLNTPGYYGFEIGYMQTRPTLTTNYGTTDANGNSIVVPEQGPATMRMGTFNGLCYFMPKGERWRPFVTAGFDADQWKAPQVANWIGGGSLKVGFNFGVGLKVKLARNVNFRVDLREHFVGKPYNLQFNNPDNGGGFIHQIEGTIGFGYTF